MDVKIAHVCLSVFVEFVEYLHAVSLNCSVFIDLMGFVKMFVDLPCFVKIFVDLRGYLQFRSNFRVFTWFR